jgi:hypothetical protein
MNRKHDRTKSRSVHAKVIGSTRTNKKAQLKADAAAYDAMFPPPGQRAPLKRPPPIPVGPERHTAGKLALSRERRMGAYDDGRRQLWAATGRPAGVAMRGDRDNS